MCVKWLLRISTAATFICILIIVLKLQFSEPFEKFRVKPSCIYLFGLKRLLYIHNRSCSWFQSKMKTRKKIKDYPWVEFSNWANKGSYYIRSNWVENGGKSTTYNTTKKQNLMKCSMYLVLQMNL